METAMQMNNTILCGRRSVRTPVKLAQIFRGARCCGSCITLTVVLASRGRRASLQLVGETTAEVSAVAHGPRISTALSPGRWFWFK